MTDLADKVKEAATASAAAERTSIEKALEAGAYLVEAKDGCQHGEWLPFLKRAGLHERRARRLMQLHRSGLDRTSVSDLGGIKAALDWSSSIRLPSPSEVLLVDTGPLENLERYPHAYVRSVAGGYHITMFDLNEASPHAKFTDKPVSGVRNVLLSLYRLLDFRIPEMRFHILDMRREFDDLLQMPRVRKFIDGNGGAL